MQRTLMVVGVAVAFAMTCAIGFAQGQQRQPTKKALLFVPADRATFKEVVPGVSKAVLWGDHDKGPYGAFTKFVPGHDVGMHTHTHDVWLVVLKGAYLYKDAAGAGRLHPDPRQAQALERRRRARGGTLLRRIVGQVRLGARKVGAAMTA